MRIKHIRGEDNNTWEDLDRIADEQLRDYWKELNRMIDLNITDKETLIYIRLLLGQFCTAKYDNASDWHKTKYCLPPEDEEVIICDGNKDWWTEGCITVMGGKYMWEDYECRPHELEDYPYWMRIRLPDKDWVSEDWIENKEDYNGNK